MKPVTISSRYQCGISAEIREHFETRTENRFDSKSWNLTVDTSSAYIKKRGNA